MSDTFKALWKPFVLFFLFIVGCYAYLFSHFEIQPLFFLALTLAGIAYWTFHEYLMHRFVLHPEFKNPRLREFFTKIHWGHHEEPEDPSIMTVPIPVSSLIGGFIFFLIYYLSNRLDFALAMMPGVIYGYLFYEWIHFWVHCRVPQNALGRWYRKNHFVHHFKDPKRCYGVTSPFWDLVFRTH